MIDPDREPGYGATARTLRLKFGVPDGETMRVFDTTDTPGSRWPAALAFGFLILTGLLALVGLIRLIRLRLAGDEPDEPDLAALARELADDPAEGAGPDPAEGAGPDEPAEADVPGDPGVDPPKA
ncbi:MAG: hypothetical protein R3F43_04145 [bacterium]